MINLLPPQYKQELVKEEKRRLVLILSVLFLIFLVSLILILFSIKISLQGQVEALKIIADSEEKTLRTSEVQILREKINLANQNLLKLKSFYRDQISSTEILEKIFQTIPSGIELTSLSWQKDNSLVSLSGFSPNREILLEFIKKLEEKKEFSEINYPTTIWVEPVDINFSLTLKIK